MKSPALVPARYVKLSQYSDAYLVDRQGCTIVRGKEAFFLNERELGRLVAAAGGVGAAKETSQ